MMRFLSNRLFNTVYELSRNSLQTPYILLLHDLAVLFFNCVFYTLFVVLTLFETTLAQYDVTPANLVPGSMNAKKEDLHSIGQKIKDFYACKLGKDAFRNANFLKVSQ